MSGSGTLVAIRGRRRSEIVSFWNNIDGRIVRVQMSSHARVVVHVEHHARARLVERTLSGAWSGGHDSVAAAATTGEFGVAETRTERCADGAEAAHAGAGLALARRQGRSLRLRQCAGSQIH